MAKCDKCGEDANIRIYGIDYCASCTVKMFNLSNTILKEDKIMERNICKHCEKIY